MHVQEDDNEDDHDYGHDDENPIDIGRATYERESSTHEHEDLGSAPLRTCDKTEARLSKVRLTLRIRNITIGPGDMLEWNRSIGPNPSRGTDTSSTNQPAADENHAQGSIHAIGAASLQIEPSVKSRNAALEEYEHQLELLFPEKGSTQNEQARCGRVPQRRGSEEEA
ncbi:hypothetical protein BDP55DRAFT_711201 [Colletotrichum godetiae]|uniref:Uncharacterized protein n=1 Tax=Colletotrichum godetiae TaxID=1209918 RepID=A0AAJ0AZ18_9PEZI|nr:uncharacterized protein BDP55DRAFT_711201 [Colletotrichum godetiae]KAK1691621.1 hypothetical protein BDP55DRAFT_711201 [Colletotrichum godetiae]